MRSPHKADDPSIHHPACSKDLLSVETGYGNSDDSSKSSQARLQVDSGFSSPVSESGSESITSDSSSCDTEERTEDVAVLSCPKYSMTAVRGRQRACAALAGGAIVNEEAKFVWPHGVA